MTSEPVKLMASTPGWVVSCSPTLFVPTTTLNTPDGIPASSAACASTSADSGVYGDGLSMTVLPVAMAGTAVQALSAAGTLNGVIAATTPIGSLTTAPCPTPVAPAVGGNAWT